MPDQDLIVRSVAHDINNQLMILLNGLDRLLVLHPNADEVRRSMAAAERCAELTALLNPRTRQAASARALVSLRCLVTETALEIRPLLLPDQQLLIECSEDAIVEADALEIHQTLVNLCFNALEAAAMADGRHADIRLRIERDANRARVSVEDNGPGVPLKLRQRIFEALFTTKADQGGTGLGLARARDIMSRHHGSISVSQVEPHGARFTLDFPIVEKEMAPG